LNCGAACIFALHHPTLHQREYGHMGADVEIWLDTA
jgi:hypothetical protein